MSNLDKDITIPWASSFWYGKKPYESAFWKNGIKLEKIQDADEALEKLASEAIIATNDKELKGCVKELNGRVLFLRQRKFLELS